MANSGAALTLALLALLGSGHLVRAQEGFEAVRDQCVACHGEGTSETEDVPSLGGMDDYYALLQLVAFRSGNRPGDIMQAMTADMTDNDLRAAAAWVASLPRPAPPEDALASKVETEGAALSAEHRCNTCHGTDYLGGKQMPPLRNQRQDYLRHSLTDFKAARRLGSRAAMVEIAQGLSDEEIDLLAAYFAGLP